MNLLAKFTHGSHLYGLNTENSDEDYKGIYLPSLRDMFLGEIKDNVDKSTNKTNEKNNSDDIDYEIYSFQKWVKLLSKGEMVCFDMLYAPDSFVTYYSRGGNVIDKQEALREGNPVAIFREGGTKNLFAHSDMKAYLGYCRRQAAKYGIKGSRLASLRLVQENLNKFPFYSTETLNKNMYVLPRNEFLKVEKDHYEVLGKKHQWTTKLKEFKERIDAEVSKYGNRAILAEQNEGIDWKAVSHAFRAGFQLQTLLQNGEMKVFLPRYLRDYIMKVKLGELDWSLVKKDLEQLMDEVEELAEQNPSSLPQKPNIDLIKWFTYDTIKDYLIGETI